MNNKRQFLLGVFFVVALSLLAAYTLFFTDTVNLFSEPILMRVYFPEANGLRNGDAVQVAGMRIGRVKDLEFDPNRPADEVILATLSLDQEIELLEGTRVTINDSTLLGGHHVNIQLGPLGGPPLDPSAKLLGSIQQNPIEALQGLGDLLTENREAFSSFLTNLDVVVQSLRDGKGVLGKLLVDEEMAQALARTIANLESTTGKIDRGEGLLGALIGDQELLDSVRSSLESIETITADLEAGKGLAGRLIYDDALADEVAKAIESFSSVGQKIDRGEGTIGRLVSDEELAGQLDEIFANFKTAGADLAAIVDTVRGGEGTLGKLLMDQELYDQALTAVKLLNRSLEDYREAAPVSAFTSVLFSAF